MTLDTAPPSWSFDRWRDYLCVLARMQLPRKLQGKLDASDIAQRTLLKAHQHADQCRAEGDAQRAAWLRRILANTLADAMREFGGAKRDASLEVSIENGLAASSTRLDAFLAAAISTPSAKAAQQEELLRLASALAQLPADQRTAIELHHLQGLAVGEVAAQLERTEASVAGLLRRGLARLRELLPTDTDQELGAGEQGGN